MKRIPKKIKKSDTTEMNLYNTIANAIKDYLNKKGCKETTIHEITEILLGITALHLGYYACAFKKDTATSYIEYVTNKLMELALETYEDDVKGNIRKERL